MQPQHILALTLILTAGASMYFNVMAQYMGVFFIIVALLKISDLEGFVNAYPKYDLIAMRSNTYAYAYPFIELTLGVLYFTHVQLAAQITIPLMTVGAIGVMKNLLSDNPVKCACLGTRINVPLTTVTLFEDLLMVAMALFLL